MILAIWRCADWVAGFLLALALILCLVAHVRRLAAEHDARAARRSRLARLRPGREGVARRGPWIWRQAFAA